MTKVLALASKAATQARSDGRRDIQTRRASTIPATADAPDSCPPTRPVAAWLEETAPRNRRHALTRLVGSAAWRRTGHPSRGRVSPRLASRLGETRPRAG